MRIVTTPSLESIRKNWTGVVLTIVGLSLLYFRALRTGGGFATLGFSVSDTCWLLKLGQIIASTALYGIQMRHVFHPINGSRGSFYPPYVVYQWLSEVTFFLTWQLFQFKGLLIACGCISALTFLCLSLRCCIRANAPLSGRFLLWQYHQRASTRDVLCAPKSLPPSFW